MPLHTHSPQRLRSFSAPRLRPCALAVHAAFALVAPCVQAQTAAPSAPAAAAAPAAADPKLAALLQPASTVEVGIAVRDGYAAKAEEYSGVTGKDPRAIANFSLFGGAAHDSASTWRWQLHGTDLGLRTRGLAADLGEQGRWRVRLGADQQQRNTSDSYQTPYQGVGGTQLTLPTGWQPIVVPRVSATAPNARGLSPDVTASPVIVGGALTAPTAAQASTATALQNADLPAFRNVDLFMRRTRGSAEIDHALGGAWSLNAGISHERREGLKSQGAPSRATGGDTTALLPVPVNESDRQLHLGLQYASTDAHLQLGYEGSSYDNRIAGVSWQLWAAPGTSATLSTAPSNQLHRLSASGGLRLGAATRLTAAASRSRGTQNAAYLADTTAPWVPVPSAQAVVFNDSANLKLQHQATRSLTLSAGWRYELRDNRTPVNLYGYYDLNNPANGASPFAYLFPTLTGLGQNFNINANTPYSRRLQQLSVDADWRASPGQHLTLGADGQQTTRWCRDSWVDCANAAHSRETTLRAGWRWAPAASDWNARVALSAAERRAPYNENSFLALVPMAGRTPSTATGALAGTSAYGTLLALGVNGWGVSRGLQPAATPGSAQAFYFPLSNVLDNGLYANGNRISELDGMRRFNQADRSRETARASLQWQATEAWQLQASLLGTQDRYTTSRYGLQRLAQHALHLDASYAPDEDLSLSVFASQELQRSRIAGLSYTANSAATSVNGVTAIEGGCYATIALRNASNKIDPCLDWQSRARDTTTTLGTTATLAQLAGGRLALAGSAVLSLAKSNVNVNGGNYVNNPYADIAANASGTTAAFYVPASDLPTARVRSLLLQLAGTWRLGDATSPQAVRVVLGHKRLRSSDWAFDALQDGGLTQLLPSREQAPQHGVTSLGLSYITGF
jgi:MtrB/PioB family decaheme-associated outer membrane protein